MHGIQLQQAVVAVQSIQKTLSDTVQQLKDIQNSMSTSPKEDVNSKNTPNHREYASSPSRSIMTYSGVSSPSRVSNSDLMLSTASAGSLLRPQHGLPPLAARGRPHFHPGQMDDSIQVIYLLLLANFHFHKMNFTEYYLSLVYHGYKILPPECKRNTLLLMIDYKGKFPNPHCVNKC